MASVNEAANKPVGKAMSVTPVTAMMDSSPNHARVHYQQTLTALARMRDAYTRFP